MIEVQAGPLIVQPVAWNLCFSRKASSWWRGALAFGRYKHVRAYAYVPYLHVWVFYDVHLTGTDIVIAADGEPANRLIAAWHQHATIMQIVRRDSADRWPVLGFCVPAMRRLLHIPGGALRPDAFFRNCLAHGGTILEDAYGHAATGKSRV